MRGAGGVAHNCKAYLKNQLGRCKIISMHCTDLLAYPILPASDAIPIHITRDCLAKLQMLGD